MEVLHALLDIVPMRALSGDNYVDVTENDSALLPSTSQAGSREASSTLLHAMKVEH